MSLAAREDDRATEIHVPTDIDWQMLDKSKFFFLGAALFSGVSAGLYPAVVLKTRQQVSQNSLSCLSLSSSILRRDGIRGFYKGFGTSLIGTIPARFLYMTALELTKSGIGGAAAGLGLSDTSATAVANGAAGLSSAVAAQLVWTPVDVISQRLMVQGSRSCGDSVLYRNGMDAFRKILFKDGPRGLYRGFGISIFTYAPSNAVWWASYSVANRLVWSSYSNVCCADSGSSSKAVEVAVQGLCAAIASGLSALTTMPLDTIKTRLQVLDGEDGRRRRPLTSIQTVRSLVKEGGFGACYKGLGPRWVSMSLSAAVMITTYEFLKRLSAKDQESFNS